MWKANKATSTAADASMDRPGMVLKIHKHAAIHVSNWLSLPSDAIPMSTDASGVALVMSFVPGFAVFCKKTSQFVKKQEHVPKRRMQPETAFPHHSRGCC